MTKLLVVKMAAPFFSGMEGFLTKMKITFFLNWKRDAKYLFIKLFYKKEKKIIKLLKTVLVSPSNF